MQFRTDLALEAAEALADAVLSAEDLEKTTYTEGEATVTSIRILTERGADAVGQPPGRYVTVEIPPLSDNGDELEEIARLVGKELSALLPEKGAVVVVGLGNESVTPDALGPRMAGMTLATRHIQGEFARAYGLEGLRPAAVMAPGVMGRTGMESSEVIRGLCQVVQPAAVIAVDALAARSTARLGCTVQLCDTGISPGSGVGNNRQALNQETLGVPVIGMGIPTVVDARTLALELSADGGLEEAVAPRGEQMMVTPREIDLIINRAARLAAMSIDAALHPDYAPLELLSVAMD